MIKQTIFAVLCTYRAWICCSRLCCMRIPSWSSWSHCWAKPTVECSVYLWRKSRIEIWNQCLNNKVLRKDQVYLQSQTQPSIPNIKKIQVYIDHLNLVVKQYCTIHPIIINVVGTIFQTSMRYKQRDLQNASSCMIMFNLI